MAPNGKIFLRLTFIALAVLLPSVFASAERLPVKTNTIADGLARDYILPLQKNKNWLDPL